MNVRKLTSLTALLSFLLTLATSIVLYIVPQGRVAYWADWKLLGLSKEVWSNLHLNLGVLFLLSLGLHIYYNWKPLVSYLKNKAREMKIFTPEFNLALALMVVFTAATLMKLPPWQWVVDGGAYFKARAEATYGAPPYGHAELSSIRAFARKTGLDYEKGLERLRKAGIQVGDEKDTLQAVAMENKTSAQALYTIMTQAGADEPASKQAKAATLPEQPLPGLGRKKISELCTEYRLDLSTVLRILRENGITAASEMNLKEIAETHQTTSSALYTMIRKGIESMTSKRDEIL